MKKIISIVGPTAVGKTKISIELAKKLNAQIISADSVCVYKGLDIGSAKPTKDEMDGVKHYLIDIVSPKEEYSVADFQKDARGIIDSTASNIILAGGTGLYVSSVVYDYNFKATPRDFSFEDKFKDYSNEQLYNYLISLDKDFDREKIHVNNRKRILRAIEVYNDTNTSIHSEQNKKEEVYDCFIVFLNIEDRNKLYERINKRVDIMVSEGLEEEVRKLYDNDIYINAIGYKEWWPYFKGELSLESVVDNIKKNTRHLAKRQLTWFRHQMRTNFYDVNLDNLDETIDNIYNDVKKFLEE